MKLTGSDDEGGAVVVPDAAGAVNEPSGTMNAEVMTAPMDRKLRDGFAARVR